MVKFTNVALMKDELIVPKMSSHFCSKSLVFISIQRFILNNARITTIESFDHLLRENKIPDLKSETCVLTVDIGFTVHCQNDIRLYRLSNFVNLFV